jgi:hypothetical protein
MHRSARWLAAVLTIVLLAVPMAASGHPGGAAIHDPEDEDLHGPPDVDVRLDRPADLDPPGDVEKLIADLASRGITVRWDAQRGAPSAIIAYGDHVTEDGFDDPVDAATSFLSQNAPLYGLTAGQVRLTTDVRSAYASQTVEGRTRASHVVIGQRFDGQPGDDLRVLGAGINVTVDAGVRVVMAAGNLLSPTTDGEHELTAEEALNAAAAALDLEAWTGGFEETTPGDGSVVPGDGSVRTFRNVFADTSLAAPLDLRVEPVWFALPEGNRAAWWTEIEADQLGWFESIVDAESGELLYRQNYYHAAAPQGTVFTGQHPDASAPRTIVPFGADWVAGTTTSGNNVNAYRDQFNSNAVGYQPDSPTQHFDYGFTNAWFTNADGLVASLDADLDAVVTQLFYYTNRVQEYLYGLGFDEPAGNFQVNNYGLGGLGGDPILAEAQDGWGDDSTTVRQRNNANFGTPPDGQSPRMQMYMWDTNWRSSTQATNPWRDGSLDGDVVAHEIGHGLSNRLVGGPSVKIGPGAQTGAMGEGWSDAVSLFLWQDNTVGEYVTGDLVNGIRSSSADANTDLFSQYSTGRGVHRNGEVWAASLYDLGQELGIDVAEQLMVDGLKTLAQSPTYVDARDGLLAADVATNAGANQCEIWEVFAARDLGLSAAATQTSVTGATDLPDDCAPSVTIGGPYTTTEGVAVQVSASASGSELSFAWDFDEDGEFDDAFGDSVLFTAVGQDGDYPISVQVTTVTDASTVAATTVTVLNAEPQVTIDQDQLTITDEGDEITVTARFLDPGWLDTHTATIDFGTGSPVQDAVVTVLDTQPWTSDAGVTIGVSGTVSASFTYGDDSLPAGFEVTVEVDDGDDVGSATFAIVVDNVDPDVAIDTDGAIDVGGMKAFILTPGEQLQLSARVTDPGSDDLFLSWDWGDGSTTTVTSLLDPPNPDPLPSPSVDPRDLVDTQTNTWGDACLYTVVLTADDDDGGRGDDEVTVVVLGNADQVRTAGYWHNQYRPDGGGKFFDAATLQCYLDIVGFFSGVFDEVRDASTAAAATEVLRTDGSSSPTDNLDRQLLALWLNVADGSVGLTDLVDTDGKKGVDTPLGQVLQTAEAVRLNPNATRKQLVDQATILDRINNRHR